MEWEITPGFTVIADLPEQLGDIVSMRIENGRLICETESGIPFVVGVPPRGDDA